MYLDEKYANDCSDSHSRHFVFMEHHCLCVLWTFSNRWWCYCDYGYFIFWICAISQTCFKKWLGEVGIVKTVCEVIMVLFTVAMTGMPYLLRATWKKRQIKGRGSRKDKQLIDSCCCIYIVQFRHCTGFGAYVSPTNVAIYMYLIGYSIYIAVVHHLCQMSWPQYSHNYIHLPLVL